MREGDQEAEKGRRERGRKGSVMSPSGNSLKIHCLRRKRISQNFSEMHVNSLLHLPTDWSIALDNVKVYSILNESSFYYSFKTRCKICRKLKQEFATKFQVSPLFS